MFEYVQTDQGIIRRILRGHTALFGALVDRYGQVVYGVAYARIGNAEDAEEVTQEAFVRLYQWLDRVVGRKTVGPWLVEVARNVATDLLRRRQREMPLHSSVAGHVMAPDHAREEMRRLVWEQLANLDEDHREVILLHYFQNTKLREIARLLNITPQTAAKRLQRARDELGRRMLTVIGDSTRADVEDRGRPSRIMAAIAEAPVAWKPSAALSVAGAAITGASTVKLTSAITAAAMAIGLCIFGGWRYLSRPYPTQEITAASTFASEKPSANTQAETAFAATERRAQQHPESQSKTPTAVRTEQQGAIIYGIVREQNGRPVPGATVKLDSETTGEEPIHLSTTTGSDGRFELPRVVVSRSPRGIDLLAETGSFYGGTRLYSIQLMRRHYIEILVEPSVPVSGQVVDANGAGIVDATVQAYLLRPRDLTMVAKTAPDGSFSLSHLVLNSYHFAVGAQGFAPLREERSIQGKQHLIFRLERGNWIGGRLVDATDGKPLIGITVEVRNRTYPFVGDGNVHLGYGSSATGDRGTFKISGLEPGVFMLQLKKEDDLSYVLENPVQVNLPEDGPVTGLELRAIQGASVSGRVLDADTGKPIAEARVSFARADWKEMTVKTSTDGEGRYSLAPFAAGEHLVKVTTLDESVLETRLAISALKAMEGIDFRVKQNPVIRGRVVDGSNTPVAGASVVAVPLKQFDSFTTTDDSGEYTVPLAAEKRAAYLQAFTDNGVSPRVGPVRAGSYNILKLQDAGAIEGTVVDQSGRPIGECYVVAVPDDTDMLTMVVPGGVWCPREKFQGAPAKTSSTGNFEMSPILPGEYKLQIYLRCSIEGYPAATARARVQAGETLRTRLVVDAAGYGAVQGTVTVNDSPAQGLWVVAKPVSDSEKWLENIPTYTDANGQYTIENLRPGATTVLVRASMLGGGASVTSSQVTEVVAAETATLDFRIGQQSSGVEGALTMDGAAALSLEIVVFPAESPEATEIARATMDIHGYYHIAGLQDGQYVVKVMDLMHQMVYAATPIEVK